MKSEETMKNIKWKEYSFLRYIMKISLSFDSTTNLRVEIEYDNYCNFLLSNQFHTFNHIVKIYMIEYI